MNIATKTNKTLVTYSDFYEFKQWKECILFIICILKKKAKHSILQPFIFSLYILQISCYSYKNFEKLKNINL